MYVRFENNEITSGPQSIAPEADNWFPFVGADRTFNLDQNYSYELLNGIVIQTIVMKDSFDWSDSNRSTRDSLLLKTTKEGWGDVDFRTTWSLEETEQRDRYRQALRDLPDTLATFATAEMTSEDLPVRP